MNLKFIDRLICYLSVTAALFFSYMPFLYIFSVINIEKYIIFISLLLLIFILISLRKLLYLVFTQSKLDKEYLISFLLYVPFLLYSIWSFIITGDLLGDTFTIRTLTLINPIFAIMAISCHQNKKYVLTAMTILSGVYFIFLIISLSTGAISFESDTFQNIFIGLESEGGYYQNINIYLGLFVICNIILLKYNVKYINLFIKIIILLSVIGMFLVGGRSSIIALGAIFLIYFVMEVNIKSSKLSYAFIYKGLIFAYFSIILVIFYLPDIKELFESSVTWRRMIDLTSGYDPSERIYLFTSAIELFLSDVKTFFWGSGINNFPVYISAYNTGMYPHNIILELLAEYGIIGLILFATPISYVLIIRKKHLGSYYGNTKEEILTFLIFNYYWIIYFFTGGLRSSWILIYFSFLLFPTKSINVPRNRSLIISTK